MAYDLLIQGGTIVDGSGAPAFRGDVAIKDGRIAEVGRAFRHADSRLRLGAGRVMDATGLVVAPGFFDMHTHYDCQLLWDPLATSSCWHGVTTVLMGNCGFTIAPARPGDQEYLMRLMARVEGISLDVLRHGLGWEWETFGQYLDRLRRGLGVNVAAQVGHSALRYVVMGPESYQRASTPEERARMKDVLRQAIADGAIGFSTSQTDHHTGGYGEPVPSRLGGPGELLELAGVLRECGYGVIGVNPKPGGADISPAFQDALVRLARESGRTVLWNSLMHRWDKPEQWRENLRFMERAAAQGAPICAVARYQRMDLEFNLRSTYMFDIFPAWKEVLHLPHEEKKRRLAEPETRARLRAEWDRKVSRMDSRRVELLEVGRVALARHRALEGQRVAEQAAAAGQHLVDWLLDLALAEDLETQFVYAGTMNGDPKAVEEIVKAASCVPGVSDAGAHLDMDCGVDFVAVLLGHWVRERGVLTLEEAVRRLTSACASVLGLTDRGLLRAGMAADVVVFDPASFRALPRETVADLPGGGRRIIQRAEGVRAVLVNGQVLLEDGRHTGAMPGRVLSPAR